LSLETLFPPNLQPLLPLSQAVQDECPPPPFALNSSELLSSGSFAVFVNHHFNWLNRFCTLPSGKEKKKQLKGKNLRSLFFYPLPEQKPPDTLSPFIESIYASQGI
jgi:hypothetical protein